MWLGDAVGASDASRYDSFQTFRVICLPRAAPGGAAIGAASDAGENFSPYRCGGRTISGTSFHRLSCLSFNSAQKPGVLGRIGAGWLLDRFFWRRVVFAVSLATPAGISITSYLLTRYFGLRAFSTLYGLTWTFYGAAGGTGPVILGRPFDSTGSYISLLAPPRGEMRAAALAFQRCVTVTLKA